MVVIAGICIYRVQFVKYKYLILRLIKVQPFNPLSFYANITTLELFISSVLTVCCSQSDGN